MRSAPASALVLALLSGVDRTAERVQEKPAAQETAAPSLRAQEPREIVPAQPPDDRRTSLNLLGTTDTDAGESRRNENIQFNLIDNNALKELNLRLGTTATIVREFQPDTKYFETEYGNPPRDSIHQVRPDAGSRGIHGELFYGDAIPQGTNDNSSSQIATDNAASV